MIESKEPKVDFGRTKINSEGLKLMSCYQDIYSDFPSRCRELWRRIEQSENTHQQDLSVTTLLVIAVAGFAMPWQYLKNNDAQKKQSADWKKHPAFKSVSHRKYESALNALAVKFAEKIDVSELATAGDKQFWTIGKCVDFEKVHDVAERRLGIIENSSITLSCLLHCLRNALAHSGFYALGSTGLNIDSISFFSEIRDKNDSKKIIGWKVATTSVEGLRHFLDKWFELISDQAQRLALYEALNPNIAEDSKEQQT